MKGIKTTQWTILGIIFLFILLYPPAQAATTATTMFIFSVPITYSHSITYGGNCGTSAFFFNEIDANFDPDVDGNAARVRPSSTRRTNTNFSTTDYNYAGVANPSDRNIAYYGNSNGTPPSTNNTPSTQFATADYTAVSTDDTTYKITSSGIQSPRQRYVFRLNVNPQIVTDLNFFFIGQSILNNSGCTTEDGTDADTNIFIWNYNTGAYETLIQHAGTGTSTGGTLTPYILAGDLNGNITPYVSSPDNNITIIISITGGPSNVRCIYTDLVNLKTTQYNQSNQIGNDTFCQSSTLAPITVTNGGNMDLNLDGNFTSAFTGSDVNVVLKAWMGTGTGCGTDGNGLGGWAQDCPITGTTTPVTSTQCRNWNSTNATTIGRLATKLLKGDTNQLCFSGDFNGFVIAGDHNQTFQTGANV